MSVNSDPPELGDADEDLLRQVHPAVAPGGRPSKTAFVPSDRDDDLLSTLRGHVGAAEAYRRWTQDFGYESCGTWAVTVGDVQGEGLRALDDAPHTIPDHASVDFRGVPTKGQKIKIGRRLRDTAVQRGRMHP